MNAPHRRDVRRHNLAGISLIELLIGITIGLLVVLAALGTLIVSRGAATAISEAAELQQQASFALRGLGLQLRQTGSLELTPVTDTADAFTFTDFTGTVVSGSDGTSGAPDRLSLGHQASRILSSRDCVGDTATAGTTVGSGYRVNAAELVCLGNVTASGAQSIIANVADFQVAYRVNIGTTDAPVIRRLTANDMTADHWKRVAAIEVCLHLQGSETLPDAGGSYVNCKGTSTTRDQRIHLVYRNVFALRRQPAYEVAL